MTAAAPDPQTCTGLYCTICMCHWTLYGNIYIDRATHEHIHPLSVTTPPER